MIKDLELVFSCFADKNRLRILKLLQKQKMCVCELAFVLGLTQPSISRHLKKMKRAGLIDSEQDGFWTNYYISPKNMYAIKLIENIKEWLNDDTIIISDLERLKQADRQKLCNK